MIEDVRELHPIGTVVRLREGSKRLMIIGRFQTLLSSDEIYDYVGCLYPEGYLKPEQSFVFNHDAIAEVVHEGLADEEEKQFLEKVHASLAAARAEGKKIE